MRERKGARPEAKIVWPVFLKGPKHQSRGMRGRRERGEFLLLAVNVNVASLFSPKTSQGFL